MARNFGRNRNEDSVTEVTEQDQATEVTIENTPETPAEAIADASTPDVPAERKVERKPVDTGEVTVLDAPNLSLSDLNKRTTKLETHPLFLALRDAEKDVVKLAKLENADKANAVKTTLRRAASKLGVGMNFGDVLTQDDGTFLPWAKTDKRVTTPKAKTEGTPETA